MKALVLSQFPMAWLTCFGLLLFFSVFCGWVYWVYRPANRALFERLEKLPFQEDV